MDFAKLPKAASDRSLLISQRFCRENRLDATKIAVLPSRLGSSLGGGEAVLCLAVAKDLLAEIIAALGTRGIHADEIAPEYMLAFAEADTTGLQAPGMALMQGSDASTILVWNKQRTIVHIASYATEAGAESRTVSRLFRYAKIVGSDYGPVALYACGPLPNHLAREHPPGELGLKLLRWPAEHGRWSRQIAAA